MKNYVIFGHNHLLGDLVDIIHSSGGSLRKIVQNIPEPLHPTRKSLKERLAVLPTPSSQKDSRNKSYEVEIQSLEAFVPEQDENYLIGFTGFKLAPLRKELKSKFGIKFEPLIHPSAIISPTAQISSGVIINAGAIIASGTFLGEHAFINRGATIGHDTVLEDYAIVQPGANVAGHVQIKCGAVIGIGATIIEDRCIGQYSMVAAGAVVTNDVPSNTLVAGVPAVYKKEINIFRDHATVSAIAD